MKGNKSITLSDKVKEQEKEKSEIKLQVSYNYWDHSQQSVGKVRLNLGKAEQRHRDRIKLEEATAKTTKKLPKIEWNRNLKNNQQIWDSFKFVPLFEYYYPKTHEAKNKKEKITELDNQARYHYLDNQSADIKKEKQRQILNHFKNACSPQNYQMILNRIHSQTPTQQSRTLKKVEEMIREYVKKLYHKDKSQNQSSRKSNQPLILFVKFELLQCNQPTNVTGLLETFFSEYVNKSNESRNKHIQIANKVKRRLYDYVNIFKPTGMINPKTLQVNKQYKELHIIRERAERLAEIISDIIEEKVDRIAQLQNRCQFVSQKNRILMKKIKENQQRKVKQEEKIYLPIGVHKIQANHGLNDYQKIVENIKPLNETDQGKKFLEAMDLELIKSQKPELPKRHHKDNQQIRREQQKKQIKQRSQNQVDLLSFFNPKKNYLQFESLTDKKDQGEDQRLKKKSREK